ncbi:unnamed protein product [Caenorhabditis bovis]|uniref:Uncharacterized protein n=1 Tax=Caenorhabditis bovis TaxID=2654633 RepID=A0A8S1FAI8_9PELO|nr:unnamed protein product [Caenorhabditis bovis]
MGRGCQDINRANKSLKLCGSSAEMNPMRNVSTPDRPLQQYPANSYGRQNSVMNGLPGSSKPDWRKGEMITPQPFWEGPMNMPPYMMNSGRWTSRSSEIDSGMNGDGVGWQGQGQHGGGRGGGGNYMGGGRRGMHQQNRMQSQHHNAGGHPHRMMNPNFRPPPQPQQPPFVYGVQDMMDLNMMRMNELSLNGVPPPQVVPPQQNGLYGELGPQANWGNQPQPFVSQEEIYEHVPPFGAPPTPHSGMPSYGNNQRGGFNRGMGNQRQNNYAPRGGFPPMPMGMPHQMPPQQQQPGQFFGAPQFPQPFPNNQPMPMHENMAGPNRPNASTMDDYAMWTDENDEEAKKKKILRDKGLIAWGDAETSNSKPIRKWIVPEGQEEDIETALARCPQFQKKKSNHEEQIRRRLGADNPQAAAQAQQQLEEERTSVIKVGKRPIVACGWGDLPADMAEKNDADAAIARVWDDVPNSNNGPKPDDQGGLPWNLPGIPPGQPSSSSSDSHRNPFFAQHMQQQQFQGNQGIFMDNAGGDGVWSNMGGIDGTAMPVPNPIMGPSHLGMVPAQPGVPEISEENRLKVAENLRYAVEKGHLDISLMTLPYFPPAALDLLTIILTKIPILDAYQMELQKLVETNRPPDLPPNADPNTWLTESQKIEYDKLVIAVVTAKIEVSDYSKKINRALIDAGIMPKNPPGPGYQNGAQAAPGNESGLQNRSGDGFENGPPDHCDYYDYSFLG